MASHGDLPPPQPGSINVPQPTPTKSIASPRVQSTGNPTMNTIETPDKSSPIGSASVDSRSQTQTPALPLFRKPESQRFAAGNAHPAKAAKIAIPRLKTASASAEEGEGRPSGRHRVNHACEPCRHRKTKCSGERPVCRHCQDFKIACYYADGKRDRVKKQFGSMTEKVADYEKLLKQIMTRVGENDADLIRSILDREDPVDMETQDRETSTLDGEVPSDGSGNESDVSAGAGSTGALDRTEEDFTRGDAKTTGFMGKNSEITWMQRLQQENRHGTPPLERADVELGDSTQKSKKRKSQQHSGATPKAHEDGFTVHASSYHLDDAPISTFEAVEAYELPTREVANHLFEAYISRVQPTFPIVSKNTLSLQFHKFMIGQLQRPPDKWLAILNLIFAIAAKYSHLIQADWRGDERDHLIYFTRARMLGLNGESVFEHVDLQHIQITGLMSFYLICTSQINRAWTLAGLAIRGATSLGMNMRNESSDLQNSYKEIRYRVWWSLYSLEHRLCSMTGRINCILEDHVTTPLPLPYEEDEFETEAAAKLLSLENQQSERNPAHSRSPSNIGSTPSTDRSRSLSKPDFSRTPSSQPSDLEWAKNVPPNSSLYFLHLIQLTRLTQGIFHKLYTPAAITGSWKDIQKMIGDLQIQLDEWYKDLPVAFDFKRKQRDRDFFEHRLSLGFFFYGTCITINRPTLCRLERKMPNQSKQSHEFNSAASAKCLEAAMEMLDLIPDEPNAIGLNRVGPFWSILHWLMQASTVLMLELSFRVYHMPQEAENILEAAQKSVRWIHSMGEENPSARRAWGFCNTMLRDAARKIGREITSLPTQPPGHASGSSESGSTKDSSKTFQQLHAPPIVYSSAPSMPNFHEVYANFDPLMHHDQYYPIETTMEEALSYGQATTAEMEFMSHAYHDSQAHQQVGTQQGGHSGPRGKYEQMQQGNRTALHVQTTKTQIEISVNISGAARRLAKWTRLVSCPLAFFAVRGASLHARPCNPGGGVVWVSTPLSHMMRRNASNPLLLASYLLLLPASSTAIRLYTRHDGKSHRNDLHARQEMDNSDREFADTLTSGTSPLPALSPLAAGLPAMTTITVVATESIEPILQNVTATTSFAAPIFPNIVLQIPIYTMCPDSLQNVSLAMGSSNGTDVYNNTADGGNGTDYLPPSLSAPSILAPSLVPGPVDATARLPNGSLTTSLSSVPSVTSGPIIESQVDAYIVLGSKGCQTLYSVTSTEFCHTTIARGGEAPISVTECSQWVTFSSDGGVAGEPTCDCTLLPASLVAAKTTSTTIEGVTITYPSQTSMSNPLISDAAAASGAIPGTNPATNAAYYLAPWYEIAAALVPATVRVLRNCLPGAACTTSTESWSLSTSTSTITRTHTVSFHGLAALPHGSTTSISYTATHVSTTTLLIPTIVRQILDNGSESESEDQAEGTVTVTVQMPLPTTYQTWLLEKVVTSEVEMETQTETVTVTVQATTTALRTVTSVLSAG